MIICKPPWPVVTRAAAVVLFAGSALVAQQAQMGTCLAFNDAPVPNRIAHSFCNGSASVSFVAPSAFLATQLEVLGANVNGLCGSVTSASGGSSGCLTTYNPFAQPLWYTIPISAISVNQGESVTVTISPYVAQPNVMNTLTLYSNPSGATPFSIVSSCIGNPCTFGVCNQPPFTANLVFRLRGPACTGGVPGYTAPFGAGCGNAPALFSSNIPVAGLTGFTILTTAGATTPGSTACLFFAAGLAAPGYPIEAGHPCLAFLEPMSLAALHGLGYEPLVAATADGYGQAVFVMAIPNSSLVIGQTATFQCLILDPAGIPLSSAPGVTVTATNALQVLVGA